MRCPKCGAFMEEGKDVCFMCGVNVRTYVPQNNNMNFNNGYNNNNVDPAFGSGANFNNGNPAFGSGANFNNNNMAFNQMKENYEKEKKNYRNVELKPVKNGEKDIFDFFSENKKIIKICLLVGLVAILALIGSLYYKSRTKEVALEPVFNSLYFEVDDSLQLVSEGSSGGVAYVKTGEKGADCSIKISSSTTETGDHVADFFNKVAISLQPELNSNGSVIKELDIYTPQESSLKINNATWHYLNIFYRKDLKSEPTQLRYKYLTSVYKGFYYNIELVNHNNDSACTASLDNFSRSLKFIDSKKEES